MRFKIREVQAEPVEEEVELFLEKNLRGDVRLMAVDESGLMQTILYVEKRGVVALVGGLDTKGFQTDSEGRVLIEK